MDTNPPGPQSEPQPELTTRKYHLVLFQPCSSSLPFIKHGDIDRDVVDYIQNHLDDVITTSAEDTEIDVWIESPGGDAHAAYKLVLDLRHRCKKLRVFIPDVAKSAATLFALGADQIFMGPAAELGPLDAQIGHPSKENLIVSALDVAESYEFVGRTGIDLSISGGASMIAFTGLARVEVLNAVLQFTARLLAPAIEKLDPHLIHHAFNQLDVAKRYAATLLSGRRHQRMSMATDAQETLVFNLVNDYPTHGFVISRADARKAGIEVEAAETDRNWDAMKALHKSFRKMASKTEKALIFVLQDDQLDSFVKTVLGSSEPHESEERIDKEKSHVHQQEGAAAGATDANGSGAKEHGE